MKERQSAPKTTHLNLPPPGQASPLENGKGLSTLLPQANSGHPFGLRHAVMCSPCVEDEPTNVRFCSCICCAASVSLSAPVRPPAIRCKSRLYFQMHNGERQNVSVRIGLRSKTAAWSLAEHAGIPVEKAARLTDSRRNPPARRDEAFENVMKVVATESHGRTDCTERQRHCLRRRAACIRSLQNTEQYRIRTSLQICSAYGCRSSYRQHSQRYTGTKY